MHVLQAVIMGIVQGLSEFLPISSSGHLVIASNLYKVFSANEIAKQSSQEVFLDIMLHLGTLIAVLIYFRKDVTDIIKALIKGICRRNFSDAGSKTGLYIALGTVITITAALPISGIAEKLLFDPAMVGLLLIGTGILLCGSELYSKKLPERIDKIDLKTSIIMGIAQGLAVFPGFSRSGLTIASALFNKRSRVSAAKYSFLLSIPVILGASMVYPLFKLDLKELVTFNWTAIIIGTAVSGIVGYLCIKYFLRFVGRYTLAFFGYYCIITGALTSAFFLFISMGL